MSETLEHLHRLYARTDDPWNFRSSPYEQEKFAATRDALTRETYRAALEIGCGNGELAHRIAPRCRRYVGIDAVERAVLAARTRVPGAEFHVRHYPCPLPGGEFDLVILSEVLYFLTPDAIARLAVDLARSAPGAEILCITYLRDTGMSLQGAEALALFQAEAREILALEPVVAAEAYRIDRGQIGRLG